MIVLKMNSSKYGKVWTVNTEVQASQEETLVHRLLGNLVLNLWDCGGQEAFMENYFASQRDNIFRNVEVTSFTWKSD